MRDKNAVPYFQISTEPDCHYGQFVFPGGVVLDYSFSKEEALSQIDWMLKNEIISMTDAELLGFQVIESSLPEAEENDLEVESVSFTPVSSGPRLCWPMSLQEITEQRMSSHLN